jgi:hypothetical protein
MSELRAPSEWLVLRMARSVCAAHAWARRANLIKNLSLAAPSNLCHGARAPCRCIGAVARQLWDST